eukprot:CAMPEP_0185769290 /NCGR_PEP_ID=MMETSP1174-20130828/53493_1 /TAXON_ID=35687 /ORGANISM="Dictyocha speculum, Strain CCMP1381" /LENGTH=115 /DNA_ID=CAMNT_0028454289 /DNA_START=64 /DNA_END=408 /DNA_ORIENTATION=-
MKRQQTKTRECDSNDGYSLVAMLLGEPQALFKAAQAKKESLEPVPSRTEHHLHLFASGELSEVHRRALVLVKEQASEAVRVILCRLRWHVELEHKVDDGQGHLRPRTPPAFFCAP